jgi:hypothetical protein
MDKSFIIKFIVKVLLYAITLIAGYLGVASLSSCSASRTVQSVGRAKIVVIDSTTIEHTGLLNFKFR